MESKFNLPTETVELPSKGLLYPQDSPLSSGTIEMKYMTAKEEDILTNTNYIADGTVIDKLLSSLIVDKSIKLDDILVGDKNALMVAIRILSYGKDYEITRGGEKVVVDLSKLVNKEVNYDNFKNGINEFTLKLPSTDNTVTIKCLTSKDEQFILDEIKGNKKFNKDGNTSRTSRLKHLITSINGVRDKKDIREFVDNYLLAKDAREIRMFYEALNPDIDLKYNYTYKDGREEEFDIPIGMNFFWPDTGL